ncbi:MAG TPA: hypothetical protein VGL81_18520 [Polyangiaceae bacterium]
MSASKDGKAETPGAGAKPATKTVVGVPALESVPPDRPSDMEMTRQLPPKAVDEGDEKEPREPSTALDVKAISTAEAERMLAWTGFTQDEISTAHAGAAPKPAPSPRPPGVAGALPRPAPRPTTAMKTLPPAADMFVGLGRAVGAAHAEPEKPTRPGVPAQAGVSVRGRATLLLDSSAPPVGEQSETDSTLERAPIVVPGAGSTPPKAVTQAPPWGEGAAHLGPPIPKGAPPPRAREPSIEEISSSMLLPDASGEAPAAGVEELSGSVLIEDAPDGRPVVTRPPAPSARPPRVTPSVKPPVPKSSSSSRPPEAAHRMLLGIPELPKSTPAPNLDFLVTAPSAPPPRVAPSSAPPPVVPPPVVPPPDAFFDAVPAPLPAFPPPPDAAPFDAAPPAAAKPELSPPQPSPTTAPMTGDIELTRLPRGGLEPLFDLSRKARAVLEKALVQLRAGMAANGGLGADGRPKWFLPVVAAAGLLVGIGLFAILGALIRGGGDSARASTGTPSSARAAGGASGQAPVAAPMPLAPVPPAGTTPSPAGPLSPCTVSGGPHVIGPSATVTAGVELARLGDDLALAFAPSDHEAIGVRLDATSLSAISTVKAHSREVVRRVTPLTNAKGGLVLAVDTDRKNDRLQGRRTVPAEPPVQLGAAGGHLSWARVGGPPTGDLWALDEGPNIESLRGSVENMGERTVAVAFRRGGAVWMGVATGAKALAPKGDLSHIEGLGTAIGSPAIALSAGGVMVAWSDRASTDEPWRLRWTRFDAGSAATSAQTFSPPAGGRGEQAMSPSLAALPGGRFLFVWTEGPASGHDVRALTFGPDGKPLGAPLVISNAGVNAGQGQAAVTANGLGVVAFLESGGNGFQVVATPIACGE